MTEITIDNTIDLLRTTDELNLLDINKKNTKQVENVLSDIQGIDNNTLINDDNDNISNLLHINSEQNVLQTREEIIKYFAKYEILIEITHRSKTLLTIYLWKWCYNEFYEHVINKKIIDINKIINKVKNSLTTCYKIQDIFPKNIYEWKSIKKYTENIVDKTTLVLNQRTINNIKQCDIDFFNYVNKVVVVLDKYIDNTSLNLDQLIEIKTLFEESYNLCDLDYYLHFG